MNYPKCERQIMASKQMCTTPLRIPSELKEWAKKEAAARQCSLNALITDLLIEARKQAQTKF
jgi:predicted HicB family RNase H-like nuclease